MDEYQHYIRLNGEIIVYGFSTAFEQPQEGDILISGQTGRHFTIQLTNNNRQFLYRYNGSSIALRTQTELDAEWAARPPAPPSIKERIQANEDAINFLLGTVVL